MMRLSLVHVDIDKDTRAEVISYARIQFDEDEFGCIWFESEDA